MTQEHEHGYHDFHADELEPTSCSVCGRGPAHWKHHPLQPEGHLYRLIKVWRKNHDDLRFGQWLWNAMNWHGLWESPEANALFFIEDEDLAKKLKEAYEDD